MLIKFQPALPAILISTRIGNLGLIKSLSIQLEALHLFPPNKLLQVQRMAACLRARRLDMILGVGMMGEAEQVPK
jgi:hypothetical protein